MNTQNTRSTTDSRTVRRLLITAGAGALAAASILGTGKASAEPFSDPTHQHDMAQICTVIAANPTGAQLDAIVERWIVTPHPALSDDSWASLGAQTLIDAINYDCPQYAPLVRAWVNSRPSSSGPAAGTVI